jgi:insertion element IS1 protein InsB
MVARLCHVQSRRDTQSGPSPAKKNSLSVQCDELWSFVAHKGSEQWVRLALDTDTREIIGAHVGDGSAQGAQRFWVHPSFAISTNAQSLNLQASKSFKGVSDLDLQDLDEPTTLGDLWESLPKVYRQCAVIYTDDWEAYQQVLLRKRYQVGSKSSGKTSYIERFNNILLQRVARFRRCSLAFSKSLHNHIYLLWNFIYHCNASLPLKYSSILLLTKPV